MWRGYFSGQGKLNTFPTLAITVTIENSEVFGPFEVPESSQPHEFDVAFEAQTLRLELVDTTGGNTGVVDIAVCGEFIE